MATAKQVLNREKSYIGTKDTGKFNRDYYGYDTGEPWCCVFQWYCFREENASKLFYNGNKTASCTAVLNWGIKEGLTVDKKSGRSGDLILFDWDGTGDADHIGMIDSQNPDGSYQTIEGNTQLTGNQSTGGQVMERTRNSCIRAIIRPKYEEDYLKYDAWCQGIGWTGQKTDGETAGTTGQSKRMEAVKFDVKSQITAQCHCQTYGDMNSVLPGNICGTVGESKRMESIKLDAPYKIQYRVHVQGIGWTDWASNGQWCGTKGEGRRIEAIEVKRV